MFNLIIAIVIFIISLIFFYLIKRIQLIYYSKKFLIIFIGFFSNQNLIRTNPDINTKDWILHRKRLENFGRSQYKGLTFFMCSQGNIYYINENGDKVYC